MPIHRDDQPPGTSQYYDRHIYPRLPKTLAIGPNDPASTAIGWAVELGIVRTDAHVSILEIGCGAGRNLTAIRRLFEHAALFGFEGSPVALALAKKVLPEVQLAIGNIHDGWPFPGPFDLIFDITVGIPESATRQELVTCTKSTFGALRPGGYAVIEAVGTEDGFSRQFGDGDVVMWERAGDTKPERLMDIADAKALYGELGFRVAADRMVFFSDKDGSGNKFDRQYFQMVVQRP
jgi:SAM-dependent methyltransferase